jgi:ankyrin repeat protein
MIIFHYLLLISLIVYSGATTSFSEEIKPYYADDPGRTVETIKKDLAGRAATLLDRRNALHLLRRCFSELEKYLINYNKVLIDQNFSERSRKSYLKLSRHQARQLQEEILILLIQNIVLNNTTGTSWPTEISLTDSAARFAALYLDNSQTTDRPALIRLLASPLYQISTRYELSKKLLPLLSDKYPAVRKSALMAIANIELISDSDRVVLEKELMGRVALVEWQTEILEIALHFGARLPFLASELADALKHDLIQPQNLAKAFYALFQINPNHEILIGLSTEIVLGAKDHFAEEEIAAYFILNRLKLLPTNLSPRFDRLKLEAKNLDRELTNKVEQCSYSEVQSLYYKGADFRADGDYPLVLAAQKNCVPVGQFFIRKGANINARGGKFLYWTVSFAQTGQADLALSEGADANAGGGEILRIAENAEDYDAVDSLLSFRANRHFQHDTLIRQSASDGQLDRLKFWEKKELNVHFAEEAAYRLASKNRHLDVVKYLADGIKDPIIFTRAAQEAIQVPDIETRDGSLMSNAHFTEFFYRDVVKFNIEKGARIEYAGVNLLEWACRNGDYELVRYLLEDRKATPTNTAFQISVSYGDLRSTKLLVAHGADITAINLAVLKNRSQPKLQTVIDYLELVQSQPRKPIPPLRP